MNRHNSGPVASELASHQAMETSRKDCG